MQRDILETAAKLLAPGGTIVYSTCTFAPEENEAMIAEFLNLNPDFTVHDIPETAGFAPGRPDWVRQMMPETSEKQVLYWIRHVVQRDYGLTCWKAKDIM